MLPNRKSTGFPLRLSTLTEKCSAVQRAVTTHSPSAIASALSGRRRATVADRTLVAQFDRMVERLSGRSNLTERFARGSPVASAWAAIEAHHHYRETRAREAIASGAAMAKLEAFVAGTRRLAQEAAA